MPKIDERRCGRVFPPDKHYEQHDGSAGTGYQHQRGRSQRRNLIEDEDYQRQRRREQKRAAPVERPGSVLRVRPRQHQPSDDHGGEPERNRNPEHRGPAQRPDQKTADGRTGAHPDRLGGREHAKGAGTPALVGRLDENRHAVRAEHRAADTLQDAKRDERGQIRRKAAQRARPGEQQESDQIEQLSAEYLAELPEYRQEGSEGEQIAERNPADALQRRVEYAPQCRQRELDDAGVELADECADAGHADDQPWIAAQARDELGRRGFGAAEDEVAQPKTGRLRHIFGAHPPRPRSSFGQTACRSPPYRNGFRRRFSQGSAHAMMLVAPGAGREKGGRRSFA